MRGPAAGRGSGLGPPQVQSCDVDPRPVPGGGVVRYCVPFGWSGLFRCLGAQRPGGPACPAGAPFLPRNGEKEGRGQAPWTPFFMVRSFPLAGFGVVGRSEAMLRLFRSPCTCPDLGRFFCVGLHNPEASPWGWEGPLPSANPPLPARPAGGRAVTGVRYRAAGQAEKKRGPPQGPPKLEKVGPGRKNLFLPGVLSSGFLPKKAGPPPGAGRATGRCAPRAASEPPTRRVRSPAPAGQGPHPTGPLFFCAILCNFFAPTVYAGVQLWPRFPRG